jgi:hypothetical protein
MAPGARVLERLSQALARLRSDRPLHRDIIDRASVVPTDQQGDRQPPAPAAGRPMARPIFAAALGAASRAGGERWRGPGALAAGGSSACCARRHVVRYAPLLINCSAENKESQHSTAQTAAAAYRHRGYEPKGHELGFTAGLLLSASPALSRWRQAVCRLLGAKGCRSSIS